jgi:hypothetical protein
MFQWKSGWSPTSILWFGSPDLNDLRSHICSKLAWAWVNISSLQRILEYRILFPWFSIYIYILNILGICFLNCCIILILCVHRILRPCFCWKNSIFRNFQTRKTTSPRNKSSRWSQMLLGFGWRFSGDRWLGMT